MSSRFAGFSDAALLFFRNLAENQNKTWFDANKPIYESAVREPLGALVTELSARLQAAGLPLRGDPKRAIFRINRDVRFSPNKAPYKTNAGCVLTRSGDKTSPGLLYFHFDPKGCFAATGFYHPEPDALHRMRLGLVRETRSWGKIVKSLAAANLTMDNEDALSRVPRGFETAPPELHEALKRKSWVLRRDIPLARVQMPGLVDDLIDLAQVAAPLLRFGWDALDRVE